jgi:dihydroorotase
MNLQTSPIPARAFVDPFAPMRRANSSFDQVVLRHLTTRAEIDSVQHLREEIDLSVHAAAGPHFFALEKKEMSSGLSLPLTWMGNA